MSGGAALILGKVLLYAAIAVIILLVKKASPGVTATRALSWLILVPTTFIASVFALQGGIFSILVFVVACLLWFGGPLATFVATPIGSPRVASTLAVVGAIPHHLDRRGLGSIAAARSCLVLRNRRHPGLAGALTYVDKRIADTAVLRPGTVVARGFCCVVLGDREQAQLLFKSVGDFAAPLRSGPAQFFAARWLIADAASRGEWGALQVLPRRLNTALTRFAAECATRIKQGPAAVARTTLVERWLLTSSRVATVPLLKMAWSAPTRPPTADASYLLARHAAALRGHVTSEDMLELAMSWDRAMAEVPPPFRMTVLDDLNALADSNPDLRGRHPYFSNNADEVLRSFEIAVEAFQRRIADERWLTPIDEWVEIAVLRQLYDDLAVDASRRSIAFDTIRLVITNYAAELFNRRHQKPIANALFLWMEREARFARDEELLQLNKKNVACGFG